MIWIPTGKDSHWSVANPYGTEIAGNSQRFAGTVYISDRYILTGSESLAQNFQATSGVVGLKKQSYSVYNWLIRC